MTLTPRQTQVLAGIGDGKEFKAIAQELGIDGKTVHYHFGILKQRTRCRGIAALVRLALKMKVSEL